ncbi:pro-sigmaK processing inhibitor BofA family protein [Clostridium sp. YIM B02505]|uniref:Pro-sigmaK processing inhibitor BofA family protein n=1 Tax=Clostridium yunnanense TaxID=2800325 RepID=A0ABS1EVT9_9CLOT|nr:pro-sigmaK processing inhibitor BofA family protein [Clostridium yunnanense]MBK1813501.1 pro-sigmaK processing inhibitor BofA family protein [Clostridium yunnanense]
MDALIFGAIGLILLVVLVRFFSWPLKILMKLLINGVLGVILLLITNYVGQQFFHFTIGINVITALIAGFFGIPGVIFLVIFKLFL